MRTVSIPRAHGGDPRVGRVRQNARGERVRTDYRARRGTDRWGGREPNALVVCVRPAAHPSIIEKPYVELPLFGHRVGSKILPAEVVGDLPLHPELRSGRRVPLPG